MRVESGGSALLSDVLYVPRLGANLLSSRKICSKEGVLGLFDDKTMYFKKGNKTLIRADVSNGIYIVSWIRKGLDETAFPAQAITSPLTTTSQDELIEPTPKDNPWCTGEIKAHTSNPAARRDR
jgi:hypothetical protein